MNPYHIGDPVVDLAQARPMVVLDAPEQSVAEWSGDNGYDLTENYANAKLGVAPDECVVRCAYLSDLRSEPSKDYTFPESRVALLDAHHADDGRRIYDRVAVDVLTRVFLGAWYIRNGLNADDTVEAAAEEAGFEGLLSEARELADVELRFDGDSEPDPLDGMRFGGDE